MFYIHFSRENKPLNLNFKVMKNTVHNLLTLALSLVLVTACREESVRSEEQSTSTHEVTHHYTYQGAQHAVVYQMNEDYEFVDRSGDLAVHDGILKEGQAYLVTFISDNQSVVNIEIFDSTEDMDVSTSMEKHGARMEQQCNNSSVWGGTTFRFYRHANYVDEFTDLAQVGRSFFQDQWIDNANDEISSFQILNNLGSVDLFEHSCYYGYRIRLLWSVPNLHIIQVGFNPRVGYGDWASSIKGWSR